jgi:RNase P subunit RPR2
MLSNLSNLHKASTTSYNSLLVKKNYIHSMEDINRNTHIIIQTIYKNLPCIHLQRIQINSFSFQVTHNCSIYTRTIHCRTTKLINHSINPIQQLSHTTNHIPSIGMSPSYFSCTTLTILKLQQICILILVSF